MVEGVVGQHDVHSYGCVVYVTPGSIRLCVLVGEVGGCGVTVCGVWVGEVGGCGVTVCGVWVGVGGCGV